MLLAGGEWRNENYFFLGRKMSEIGCMNVLKSGHGARGVNTRSEQSSAKWLCAPESLARGGYAYRHILKRTQDRIHIYIPNLVRHPLNLYIYACIYRSAIERVLCTRPFPRVHVSSCLLPPHIAHTEGGGGGKSPGGGE